MNKFKLKKTVTSADIDDLHHANNLVYLQWAQEVSKLHWKSRTSEKQREDYIWVVSRQEIDYKKELRLNEEVIVETFVEGFEKQKSFRRINIYNSKSDLVSTVLITWVLINGKTKKPMRVPAELINSFNKL